MAMVKGKVHFDREPVSQSLDIIQGEVRVVKLGGIWVDIQNSEREAVDVTNSFFQDSEFSEPIPAAAS
jgi:hypothetical protein